MVRPIDGAKVYDSTPIYIGGVKYNTGDVCLEHSGSYMKDGVKMNSVFLKYGVHLTYPDQTNKDKKPQVFHSKIEDFWYKPDYTITRISDIENATIYGTNNQPDHIELGGKSTGNTVNVEDYGNFIDGNFFRNDRVYLSADTENNKVIMDPKDNTCIEYFLGQDVYFDSRYIGRLEVKGEGTSSQEAQLKDAIENYNLHKNIQKESE